MDLPRLCLTVTAVIGLRNAIDYGCAHRTKPQGNMKDDKKLPEDSIETRELEQLSDFGSEDDTKRLRTLTVHEIEQLLKDKKPGL